MTTPSKSILFIAAGGLNWGSSRMRAYWPAQKIKGANCIMWQDENPEIDDTYRAYVFQKVFHPGIAKAMVADGKRVFWDACDPLWWWHPDTVSEIAQIVDGITCSSRALAADLRKFLGPKRKVYTIKDSIDLDHFRVTSPREPITDPVTKQVRPLRLIWFGLGVNRISLFGALANIERLYANGVDLTLTIFDDGPKWEFGNLPVKYIPWSVENEVSVISSHDLSILPPYPGPWGVVKSDNKQITSLACLTPFLPGDDYLHLEYISTHEYARSVLLERQYRRVKSHRSEVAAGLWAELSLGGAA